MSQEQDALRRDQPQLNSTTKNTKFTKGRIRGRGLRRLPDSTEGPTVFFLKSSMISGTFSCRERGEHRENTCQIIPLPVPAFPSLRFAGFPVFGMDRAGAAQAPN